MRFARILILPALAASVTAAMVLPGSAFAKGPGPKPAKATCSSLGGNTGSTANLSGCLPTSATGGSGTFPGSVFATHATSGTAMVTWNGTGTTSFHYTTSIPQSRGDKCAKGSTEAILHGAVSGNTPIGNAGVKGALHAKVCIDSSGNLSLLSGSGPFRI